MAGGIAAAASMLVGTAVISTGVGMIAAPAMTEFSKQWTPESSDTSVPSVVKQADSGSSADEIFAKDMQAIQVAPDEKTMITGKTVPEPPTTLLATGVAVGAGVLLKLLKKKKILKADPRNI